MFRLPHRIAKGKGAHLSFHSLDFALVFIYLFTGTGVVVLFIACCGCIGTATRNGCCLTCYSVLLILVGLGTAAFIFFDKRWKEEIPTDKTGNFDMIYEFLEKHWEIVKWIALGVVILEALVFLLALVVRAANSPADYDRDEEYIGGPRQQIRQQLHFIVGRALSHLLSLYGHRMQHLLGSLSLARAIALTAIAPKG
ncbi:hypothetical protein CDL12_03952 [Handroanthus impetiginosus]|uniref:Uncharacterized protein n=1 Tax=Handroanthus impetiginosus TaxID=429701 RepID=A0A2G9I0U7_9LAMI|nr:hypothetical protein CDL12_03952 [Handroanthus impetiginosus]